MLLSANILNDLQNVNSFEYANTARFSQGDGGTLDIQLIDISKTPTQGLGLYAQPGLRYMPATGATLQCTLKSIDDAATVQRFASQPFPTSDPSIWRLTLMPGDVLSGTYALQLKLVEGGTTRTGSVQQAVSFQSSRQALC